MYKIKAQGLRLMAYGLWVRFLIISFFFSAFSLQLLAFSPSIAFAQDKIIAIVNNEVITQKDLNEFINFMKLQLSKDYSEAQAADKIKSMRLDMRERLIEDRIILQEAKKANIRINEERIKAKIDEIKSHYSSEAEFQSDLAKQGLVQSDLEQKIREQLLMYYIIEIKVKDKITIRPQEVTDLYNRNKKDFISPEEREVIVVTLENRDQARTFSFELNSGKRLEDLAVIYSITFNSLKFVKGQELRGDIEDVIFSLALGYASDPVEIDGQYYVFKLENITPSRQLAISEVQDKIHNAILEDKMQKDLAEWLDGLKKKAYIKMVQDY